MLYRPMLRRPIIFVFLLTVSLAANCQSANRSGKGGKSSAPPPAEDISGMYSFLEEGEFVQINLEPSGVSGYISRKGDLESDRGNFIDQFFDKASVEGHDVAFTTRKIHGEWFEFKGRFERGKARSKSADGYYILRGTLTEFNGSNDEKNPTSKAHEVELKWLAQPGEEEPTKPKSK